ncbi:MAG: PTS sugar transporter subunit IIA [Anaerorhabdus sp.]
MILQQILDNKLTRYEHHFETWQEAIKASALSMIEEKFIDETYVDEILACVEKYGPYIVIAPDIAMPHSTEGSQGVYKTGIGFMKVEVPVHFDLNDPEKDARLFFVLASENHEQHLENMMNLSEMLMEEEIVAALLQAKGDEDLKSIIEQYKN